MDKQTRENQKQVRQQKAQADAAIWAKVPPKVITRSEAGFAKRYSPRRVRVSDIPVHPYTPSSYPDGSSTCVFKYKGLVCDYVREYKIHDVKED